MLFYRLRFFSILEKNFRTRKGEVDLIVRRGGLLVFVEVKARQQDVAGAGFEAVDRVKQLKIVSAAEEYLHKSPWKPELIRFDVISLHWDSRRFMIQHFPSAFECGFEIGRPWRAR